MTMSEHAERNPDKLATIMAGSGASLTFGELNARSIQLARLLRDAGLAVGDVVALFMENNLRYHETYWAAVRSGLYVCAVNKYLTAEEAAYIVNNSGAKALVTSAAMGPAAAEMTGLLAGCPLRLALDGPVPGFERYEDALASQSTAPLDDEPRGDFMNYSSGTTGRPKGVKRPLTGLSFTEPHRLDLLVEGLYGFGEDTVYLSPAPLYHAAPLGFTASTHSLGGTIVVMEKFNELEALRLIEARRVTHSQWVPTMFVRMLKLPEAQRTRFDFSSHACAIHAAAPCPNDVKRQMIDWWGPIIREYYGATELNGMTVSASEEWLKYPGTVGKPILGELHICDEAGRELPTGEAGLIYFERDEMPFEYFGDPEKTAAAQHPDHPFWTKLGDVGFVNDEGYLFLTDRESFMIISGGVNIYPQEIEDCIVMHPKVADVAVFGVPNPEFGEEVKAVVQPAPGVEGDPDLEAELIQLVGDRLAHYKRPRSVDFMAELPRLETGKLYKRLLKDRYWGDKTSRIV